jgi:hypothetical protein
MHDLYKILQNDFGFDVDLIKNQFRILQKELKSNSEAPNDESRWEMRVMSKKHWFRYRRVVGVLIDVMCCAGCVASVVG